MRSPAPIHIDGYHVEQNRNRREDDGSSLANVMAGVSIIFALVATLIWLPACASQDMSRDEAVAISAIVGE